MLNAAWWRLVKFGFRLLYNEMAFTYDTVATVVSLGQWWDWQRCALKYLPPDGSLLELAHGTGRFQVDLMAGGWQVVGFDLSPQMGRITRRRLHRHQLPVKLVRGMAQTLPFPDRTFAAVVSTFPTPFIIEPATLSEIRRVLHPGGRLVIVPNGILTKGGAARTVLESAYRATGQRGPWPVDQESRFREYGFTVQLHLEELERSTVQVCVADLNSAHAEI